jgi:Fic family protein
VYKPPQCGEDVELLLQTLVSWHAQLHEQGLPALIRAPLVHFYYELIHPFWDGNGRVGRVIEATILQQAGFQYAPFAQASFYHQHIHRYFALFNQGRKQAQLKQGFPNTDFVAFFLDGILQSINNLHDRVNFLIGVMLFDSRVQHLYQGKSINDRQYAIVTQIMRHGPVMLKELAQMPWYRALYIKLTDKTKSRDLHKLKELGLLRQESTGLLMPGSI